MKIMITLLLAALALLAGCAKEPLLDPNYKAALEAWERVETAKQKPTPVLDIKASEGKSIELSSLTLNLPSAGQPLPPPKYEPPPGPLDRIWAFLTRLVEVGGPTAVAIAGINTGGEVLEAAFKSSGQKITVGGNYYSGEGAGDNRGNVFTTAFTYGGLQ